MKNNAHETISKRYVVQDSSNLTLTLDRSNSAAAISQAASGSPAPTMNNRIEDWIERMKCIAASGVWLPFAAIRITHAKKPMALSEISAMVNLCPMRSFVLVVVAHDPRFANAGHEGLQLSVPINASSAAATCQRIVDQHHNDRAHDCDDHAVDIQSSYA